MTVRNLLTLNAIFAFVSAAALIFFPSALAGIFDAGGVPAALRFIQVFGSGLTGYGFASWWMRGAGPSEARTAFLKAGGAGYFVVTIVIVSVLLIGSAGSILWVGAAASLLLGAAFLALAMRSPDAD